MTTAVPLLERQEVLAALGSSNRGLSAGEAAARRAETGANQLPAARRRSVLAEFGSQFANMFAVVLMVAAGITFGAYALSTPRDSASLVLAIGILGVVLLNAVIGFAQEHAAERTAEALQALVPATARVIRDGELTEVPAVDLVPGDLVMLDAGDAISADCRLIDSHDLLVEMAALTGESRPTPRICDAVPQAQPADARNCVFMGTSAVNGSGRAVVFATGLSTEFGIATVGSVQTTVNRLVRLLHHRTLEAHQTFGNGETLLVRSKVPAYLAGRRVAEFNVPGEIGVVELSRAGHSSIPEPSATLQDGDVLSFIVAAASLGRLRSFLGGKWS